MRTRSTFARLLELPENRSALAAIRDLVFALTDADSTRTPQLLFLHGPPGSGKTFLLSALVDELAASRVKIWMTSANEFAAAENLDAARHADLLIIEDLHHLPARYADAVIRLIDERAREELRTICSALVGPGRLRHRGTPFSHRLTNRLSAGLVVGLEPLQTPSRRRLLQMLATEAKLTITPDVLDWLAEHMTGGGRQLEGAIRQLKALQRLQAKPLRLADVRGHFRTQIEAQAPTVERIAEHVGGYFQVTPKRLLSARRSRDVLLPRQVSMYLARQLTDLSLQKIGKYFGGRDHKTVQHACVKVEAAMKADAVLSGAVRQMHAELA